LLYLNALAFEIFVESGNVFNYILQPYRVIARNTEGFVYTFAALLMIFWKYFKIRKPIFLKYEKYV